MYAIQGCKKAAGSNASTDEPSDKTLT